MKSFNLKKDLPTIRDLFNLSRDEFAQEIGLSRMNIHRIETGLIETTPASLEAIYSFPYEKKFNLNKAKEMLFDDNKHEQTLLFHGAKEEIKDINVNHLNGKKDLGAGLYLAENYDSASMWVCEFKEGTVYAFYLKPDPSLKVTKFTVSKEWLYAVLYYRGVLNNYVLTDEIKGIIQQIEESDIVIAPIADNRMYDIIRNFSQSLISDIQCLHALSATDLGMQYLIRTEKAKKLLRCLDRMYISKLEKHELINRKNKHANFGENKAQLATREYAHQGNFIHELFKTR